MGPDDFNGSRNLSFRESKLLQDRRRHAGDVSHMVPRGQCRRVFRTVADEYPEVVHPGGGIEDVVVVCLALGEPPRELVKPGLVAELVGRLRLGADVVGNGFPVSGLSHGARIAAPPAVSNPSVRTSFRAPMAWRSREAFGVRAACCRFGPRWCATAAASCAHSKRCRAVRSPGTWRTMTDSIGRQD